MPPKKSSTQKPVFEYSSPNNNMRFSPEELDPNPFTMKALLMPYALSFIKAARKMEDEGGLSVTVPDTDLYPFNQMNVDKGDRITISSRIGFYCDLAEPIEAYLGVIGLICTGAPEASVVGPGVVLASSRPRIRCNLIIVPPARFETWKVCLGKSFLRTSCVGSPRDLEPFKRADYLPELDVVLLSSKVYPAFDRLLGKKRIRWARVIYDEHENNPADAAVLLAERYWSLVSDPESWISHPSRKSRFQELVYPANLFSIRSSPSYIQACHNVEPKRRETYGGEGALLDDLGLMAFRHFEDHRELMTELQRKEKEAQIDHYRKLGEEARSTYRQYAEIQLKTYSKIGGLAVRFSDAAQVVGQIMAESDRHLTALCQRQSESAQVLREKLKIDVIRIHNEYRSQAEDIQREYSRRIAERINSEPKTGLTPLPYRILYLSKDISPDLESIVPPEGYMMVAGRVKVAPVFVTDDLEYHYLVLAVAPQTRVLSMLSSSELYPIVVCPSSLGNDPKDYYRGALEMSRTSEYFFVEHLVVELGSQLMVCRDSPCLIIRDKDVDHDTVRAGASIILN